MTMLDDRYCAVSFDSFPIQSGKHLLSTRATNRRVLLTTSAIRVLHECQSSMTLPELARRSIPLVENHTQGESSIETIIADLVALELLRPLATIFDRTLAFRTANSRIGSVIVVTANRPRELQRALCSYLENFRTYDKQVQVIVVDDSQIETATWYGRIPKNEARSVRLAGVAQKQLYIEHLARIGIDPAVARFAILGQRDSGFCSIGANRNSALLDTLDELIFSIDDDTTCNLFSHPECDNGLVFSCGANPRDLWSYDDRDHLLGEISWQEFDILGQHERLLGKSIPELVSCSPLDSIHVSHATADLLRVLETGEGSIAATMSGIIGDSANYSGTWLLNTAGPTAQRLASSEGAFRQAFQSREVLWVARSFTAAHSRFCMTTNIGLDNRELLPPFFPVGRNEDGVFGTMLNLISPTMLTGHVPIAVLHNPTEQREYNARPDFRISDLVICLLLSLFCPYKYGVRENLRYFGRELLEISKLREGDFWVVVSRAVSRNMANRLRRLEWSAQDPVRPSFWRQAIAEHVEWVLAQYAQPDYCIPVELKQVFPLDVARHKTRELVAQAGALFYSWPDVIAAARELRTREIRITSVLDTE